MCLSLFPRGAIRRRSTAQSYSNKIVTKSVTLTTADTDYSFKLPNRCVQFDCKLRSLGQFRMYDKVGGMFVTYSGAGYSSPSGIPVGGEELVVQSPVASQVLEIIMIVGGN